MSESEFLQRNCPGCGSGDHRLEVASSVRAEDLSLDELRPFWSGFHEERRFFSYHRCDACGLLFAPVFFTDDQLEMLYAELEPNMGDVSNAALEATQRGYFEFARGNGTRLTGGYLEIGPDIGYISRLAANAGEFDHFWLFEPNRAVHPQLAASTLGRPHTILDDMTDLSAVPDGSVGLAVMVHVLDHLLDPVAMLRQIHAKLRDNGMLLVVTHNEASLLRRILGRRWPPFCLQHPAVYNPRQMELILTRAGFADVAVTASINHFPVPYLAKQASLATHVGLLERLPLPPISLALRLGNIQSLGRRSGTAAPAATAEPAMAPVDQLEHQ